MDLPKISGGGMFDSVKSKLGFGNQDAGTRRGAYNDYYNQANDGYAYEDDYDDYAYEDDYSNGYPDYVGGAGQQPSSRYEPYGQVTTRSASSNLPRLVSIDDVRASTQIPSSLNRDPLPQRRTSSSSFRTLVNECAPAPNSPADVSMRKERSESLDDLFESTASSDAVTTRTPSRSGLGSSPLAASTSKSSYDPYDAYSGSSSSKGHHAPQRNLKVLHPLSYGDVEQVAKILRAGDAAVLALDATPADLSKRILDFSFGVASALDASVDCIASKVFFIATGAEMSEVERMHLRAQGVL